MPELPEVETIRYELAPRLVGRTIISARTRRPDIVGYPSAARLGREVKGLKITGLGRRGKYLVCRLSRGKELILHLRLSGRLEVLNGEEAPKYERARFGLCDGNVLSFVEPRVLGKVYLVDAGDYPKVLRGMEEMGEEPVSGGFTWRYLADRLSGRKASVKSLLLDQRICCGVGNIYSDEALFRAGVLPTRGAGSLTPTEVNRLARGLRSVIRGGIRWCGTTLADGRYLRPGTERGAFQRRLKVFGREGEDCRSRCGGKIERVRISNRSSYYCPVCQR